MSKSKTKKELYKQSETVVIWRSEINKNPFNPKTRTKEDIAQRKANIKRVGLIGGIRWNKTSGNLIDGHGNLEALDLIHKYDGTKATDYQVKVEQCELDEKTEREQLVYFTKTTEIDREKMIELIPMIDYEKAGLEMEDLNYYLPTIAVMEMQEYNADIRNDFDALEKLSDEEKKVRKQKVKEAKQATKEKMVEEVEGAPYVTLSFSDYEAKVYFMELLDEKINNKYIKGEKVLQLIDR